LADLNHELSTPFPHGIGIAISGGFAIEQPGKEYSR
jgi:hypothetical protein